MFHTYTLTSDGKMPLYEQLYRAIRADILAGRLSGGEKLPSKRQLAEHLSVSKITVETAYAQLLAEGYISSRQRAGYFVEHLPESLPPHPAPAELPQKSTPPAPTPQIASLFPFSVWARLMRAVLLEQQDALLQPTPHMGMPALQQAIADELWRLRGMQVRPEQIVIGAGAEYFYNLLLQFFGREKHYALEALGHRKIERVYRAGGAKITPIQMDDDGIVPEALFASDAQILHISPSHHYPTGAITPVGRRRQIMQWLAQSDERFVIEDDYDSEFRFSGLPIPTLQSMDTCGRVIYLNTFSKTLTPAIRISYMILPTQMLDAWQKTMGFYSCAVPSFEQLTLARFLREGYFEKHLGRMRKHYRTVRTSLLQLLSSEPLRQKFSVLGSTVGLHFIVRVHTRLTDDELSKLLREAGLEPALLSSFYIGTPPQSAHGCFVLHYAQLEPQQTAAALEKLAGLL